MKTKILYIIMLFTCAISFSQTTAIPDANFEQALINLNIDSDGIINGQVLTSDINTIVNLDVSSNNIADITGIEGFVSLVTLNANNNNLTFINLNSNLLLEVLDVGSNNLNILDINQNTLLNTLGCVGNNLSNLDVTQNVELTHLFCSGNNLTSLILNQNINLIQVVCNFNFISNLDLSSNLFIYKLSCYNNNLTSLDLSQNLNLTELFCSNNPLTSLDVSQNTNLKYITCTNNQLINLNVKNTNNVNFVYFSAFENPDLTCIEVDDANWSTANWLNIDPQSYFSENCNLSTIDFSISNISLYPNPTKNNTTITLDTNATYTLVNIHGQYLQQGKLNSGDNEINLSWLPTGLYFINIKTEKRSNTLKLIKQ